MSPKIAVVLPCYKSRQHVLEVIRRIGPEVFLIVAVDDACPMKTGAHIESDCSDPRMVVVANETNLGVGGAVIHGYRVALGRGAEIIVKIDSDGQMDPAMLPQLVHPIVRGLADYTKGNRFYNSEVLSKMPALRLLGNAALSFLTKFSSGYWTLFDPTNGYTAIHRTTLEMLPLESLDRRFFFESDMLFRLYLAGAVIIDVPIRAAYSDEQSNLRVGSILPQFLFKNIRNFLKRIFYRYFLRDLNLGSLELLVGTPLVIFGVFYGTIQWISSAATGIVATAGTVMLAGLPILVGLQMILGFFAFDLMTVPKVPLQTILGAGRRKSADDEMPP